MLTEKELEDKLREYAAAFNIHVRTKEWGKAHNVYNMTLTTAVMTGLSREFRDELFGGYDESDDGDVKDGLFRREDVAKVNTECCIRRNMAYEDMECRKAGKAPRYYSEEGYCAICKKGDGGRDTREVHG